MGADLVTKAWINAKNGKAAVALAIDGAGAASQALNAYLAKRQGAAVADGLKPNFEAQQVELVKLKEQLDTARKDLSDAQASIMSQQRAIDGRNFWLGFGWYILGAATPYALKYAVGISV
jgi:hypothetical protein